MKIAFVTPWYGPAISGGMESETRRIVAHLRRAGFDVEVLTTCIRDFYSDWSKNYHKPGIQLINGIKVRRFRVGKRDKQTFDRINWHLIQGLSISAESERTFINEMFCCPDLYQYIEQHRNEYIFFFIPYMFASTYFGAQVCPENSVIIPCLHDESYARLNIYQEILPRTRGVILFTDAEHLLFEQLFGQADGQFRRVLGAGVDTDFEADGDRFRDKYGLNTPFLLYVGRRELGKNTPLLIDYWQRYVREEEREAKLILIGPGEIGTAIQAGDNIIDLGFVSTQDKFDAYAAATVLCQPSLNESFSLVIMESWLVETPVLVHGNCAVTREHCRKCNGGLYFTHYEEFVATLDYLFGHPTTANQMGVNGRNYVLNNFQWSTIAGKYQQLITDILTG